MAANDGASVERGSAESGTPARQPWWVEWRSGGEPRRVPLTGRLTVGRSPLSDVVIEDPYVSREHCSLELTADGVRVDATGSLNRIRANGEELERLELTDAGSFSIGQTTVHLRPISLNDDTTLRMTERPAVLTLRRSTRELFDATGATIAQLSVSEAAVLETIAGRFPDAAPHDDIAIAVWGDSDYDRYLIHRLVQRLRDRMGGSGDLVENVRGAGYRLRAPIDLR
jgi:Inner membrane component of T3SS, cytoplasmic domain/Transcriptional regulatory protein, C terminal